MKQSYKNRSSILGYSFNTGGLNNQKLALLGLFTKAYLSKKPFVLPMMNIKDHVQEKNVPISLTGIFDINALSGLASKYGMGIIFCDPYGLDEGGWNFFGDGAGRVSHLAVHRQVNDDISKFIFNFFECLIPKLRNSIVLNRIKREVFEINKITVAAQFRIESDWKMFSAIALQPTIDKPEDYFLSYDKIVAKIIKTLPETKKILVFCDEAALLIPKNEMREFCRLKMGVELFWKSDFLSEVEMKNYNNLELSLIDFELAIAVKNYIGLSRSTFSNMVTFEKYARSRQLVTTDYIYNNDQQELGLRRDNGGSVDHEQVVR